MPELTAGSSLDSFSFPQKPGKMAMRRMKRASARMLNRRAKMAGKAGAGSPKPYGK